MCFNAVILLILLPSKRSVTTSIKGFRAKPSSTWRPYSFSSPVPKSWTVNATYRRDMLNAQLILLSWFCRIITSPFFPITMSFVFRYPGGFQNPKATCSTLSIQVLPGKSLKVQSNVKFPCFFPIMGWLGPEIILGRCSWCEAERVIHLFHSFQNWPRIRLNCHVFKKLCSTGENWQLWRLGRGPANPGL